MTSPNPAGPEAPHDSGDDADPDLFGRPGSPVGFDPARDRLRLTPRHFAALTQLAAGGEVADELAEDLAALRAAGVVTDGGVLPDRVAELVAAFAGPSLLVHVETTAGPAVVSHAVAVRHRTAWTSEAFPGTAVSEFAPLDPLMLVPALARIVNLLPDQVTDQRAASGGSGTANVAEVPTKANASSSGAPPGPAPRTPLRVPVELLDRAWTALALAGPAARERAVAVVRDAVARLAPDVPATDLDVLTHVLTHHRLAWRVTTSWQTTPNRQPSPTISTAIDRGTATTSRPVAGDAGAATPAPDVEVRALAVIDAGPAGLWRRDEPAEPLKQPPGHDAWITLTPVTTSQTWHALADLLPGRNATSRRSDAPRIRLESAI